MKGWLNIMILYKNVDIIDLDSIIKNGILSLNESKNNNWDEGKRANNSCDVVYLFNPITDENSFCNYGVALIEVDIPEELVRENKLSECDVNKGKYVEYIADRVDAKYITHIYVPQIFRSRIEHCDGISDNTLSQITWCELTAYYYGDSEKEKCPDEILSQFAKTANIIDTTAFNFFRGKMENREIIDLYDIKYILIK